MLFPCVFEKRLNISNMNEKIKNGHNHVSKEECNISNFETLYNSALPVTPVLRQRQEHHPC